MEEEQVEVEQEVTTEEYETNSDSEGETTEGDSETGDSERTYTQAEVEARIKEQDRRWKDRLKDSKKSASKEETKEEVDERFQRLDLKTEGITNKKEQDIIIDIAKYKKISTTEAMQLPSAKAELAELRAKNVPAPSTRTSGGPNDSYAYYVKQIKSGKMRLKDVTDAKIKQRLMNGSIFN